MRLRGLNNYLMLRTKNVLMEKTYLLLSQGCCHACFPVLHLPGATSAIDCYDYTMEYMQKIMFYRIFLVRY